MGSDEALLPPDGRALREAAVVFDTSSHAAHPMDGISAEAEAVKKCLAVVKAEARKDLKL